MVKGRFFDRVGTIGGKDRKTADEGHGCRYGGHVRPEA